MADDVLQGLLSQELLASASAISGASAMRQFFARRDEVQVVATALERGSIAEDAVRLFAEGLLKALQRKVLFCHDLTLAALAVALAEQRAPFADEYLRGLAGLQAAEMPFAPRVAREVLSGRQSPSANASPAVGHEKPALHGVVSEDAAGSRR